MTRRFLLAAALVCFGVLAFLPMGVMLRESFQDPEGAFTLEAWRNVLASATERQQLVRSLLLGLAAVGVAVALGGLHVLATERTDLPAAGLFTALGVTPLMVPPILVAYAWSDILEMTSFTGSAFILGISHSPFVSVLLARGLRSTDGRLYEAALLARGRGQAEGMLLRIGLPDLMVGALLVFVFALSDHGVPEFLSVKGKTWYVYAENIFLKYAHRGSPGTVSGAEATAASAPLLAVTGAAVLLCLLWRRKGALATRFSDFRPLPTRRLGRLKVPALVYEVSYLSAATLVPMVGMLRWSAGSTTAFGLSAETMATSFRRAVLEVGEGLGFTAGVSVSAAVAVALLALPIAHGIARGGRPGRALEAVSFLPIAVPGILLGIGLVRLWNTAAPPFGWIAGPVYDSFWMFPLSLTARFLPLAILSLANAFRRVPVEMEEAALLSGRGAVARGASIQLPLMVPAVFGAAALAFVLCMRELDLAVTVPAGNPSVVRRLSNIVHFGGEDVGGALAVLLLLLVALPPVVWYLATGRKVESVS